jgi:protoporphyrin/coproporphyrin ferrochelatase
MTFHAEHPYTHGTPPGTAVLVVNLGTPEAPTAKAVRKYLAEFLWDKRVVEIPRPVWWLILHGVILRVRPAKSAAKYASIWQAEGSPLALWTQKLTAALRAKLAQPQAGLTVAYAMRYGQPSVAQELSKLRAQGVTRVLVMPLYPQYAAATTASVFDAVANWASKARWVPELRFVHEFHDDAGYIDALAQRVQRHWEANGRGGLLIMSFHGVPERSLHLGDPYHCQCYKTARLLAERLGLTKGEYRVTFQSRLGRAKWLQPYTEPTLVALAKEGVSRVDLICPGFVSDCLETLEEINVEAREAFLHAGGREFHYIPCLNDDAQWVNQFTAIAQRHLQGWPTSQPSAAELQAQASAAKALGSKA